MNLTDSYAGLDNLFHIMIIFKLLYDIHTYSLFLQLKPNILHWVMQNVWNDKRSVTKLEGTLAILYKLHQYYLLVIDHFRINNWFGLVSLSLKANFSFGAYGFLQRLLIIKRQHMSHFFNRLHLNGRQIGDSEKAS